MPIHEFREIRGTVRRITIESKALRDNLLGDPARRTVAVYLPPGYEDSGDRYPLFVDLVGFTGSGLTHLGWRAFGESVPQRLERLIREGRMGPVIAAFPDCFTSLGGNQYINSTAIGRWEDFLLLDVLPRIESEFRTEPGKAHRAVFGKSSGGYGAIVQGLRHGNHWGAVACHSGDMGFDLLFRDAFPRALNMLARHDDSIEAFLKHISNVKKISRDEMHTLMTLAMAATYDPDPDAHKGIRLPVDPHTCEMDERRWANWLAHDPVRMLRHESCRESLRALGALYIDCGWRDQYHLHYGARAFVRGLKAAEIPHRYEEFDDDHSSVDYRMDVSLPLLYDAVK